MARLQIRSIYLPALVAVITLLLLRLPATLMPYELHPDESQMLSQAMKFLLDPVPWRSVDGTTSGPFNSYVISLWLWFGLKPSYLLVHILADVLICGQLFVTYGTLLHLATKEIAAWAMLPMVLFFGLAGENDFLHYSSELLPAFLLATSFFLLAGWLHDSRNWRLFLAGLLLGAAPLCKLQSTPIAGVLGLSGVAAVILTAPKRRSTVDRYGGILMLIVAGLIPGAVIIGIVFKAGALQDFWQSYILGNLAYAGSKGALQALRDTVKALMSLALGPLVILNLTGAVWLLWTFRKEGRFGFTPRISWMLAGLLLYCAAALAAVSRPAALFGHYLIFLEFPLTCLAGTLAGRLLSQIPRGRSGRRKLPKAVDVAMVLVVLIYGINACLWGAFSWAAMGALVQPIQNANIKLGAKVKALEKSRGAHSLAIWGWMPGLYVASGIAPATRDAIGHYMISPGPFQGYYRARFLADLQKAQPDLFIDAVAPGAFLWTWKGNEGYESYPALAHFVDEHYVLVDRVPLRSQARPVRIFARRR